MTRINNMAESFLLASYPPNTLDELVIKTVMLHPYIIRRYVTECLKTQHGIDEKNSLDGVMMLMTAGLIERDYGRLRPAWQGSAA